MGRSVSKPVLLNGCSRPGIFSACRWLHDTRAALCTFAHFFGMRRKVGAMLLPEQVSAAAMETRRKRAWEVTPGPRNAKLERNLLLVRGRRAGAVRRCGRPLDGRSGSEHRLLLGLARLLRVPLLLALGGVVFFLIRSVAVQAQRSRLHLAVSRFRGTGRC